LETTSKTVSDTELLSSTSKHIYNNEFKSPFYQYQVRHFGKNLYVPLYQPGEKEREIQKGIKREQIRQILYQQDQKLQANTQQGSQLQDQTENTLNRNNTEKQKKTWSFNTHKRRSRVRHHWNLTEEQFALLRCSNLPQNLPHGHPDKLPSPATLMEDIEKEYIEKLNKMNPGRAIADFKPGDRIKITKRLSLDKEKYEEITGMCIAKTGGLIGSMFTILNRKQEVDYELQYPIHSPFIAKIEILERKKVRRAKLYYLRNASPKEYIT